MLRIDDPDFKLYVGDVREQLAQLEDGSVDCVVTSPPYFGLRDYGTGTWEGGDPGCDHSAAPRKVVGNYPSESSTLTTNDGAGPRPGDKFEASQKWDVPIGDCPCGAVYVDRQIGLERTPQDFVAELVDVFREVRRVLAPHGTVWINIGDSYNAYNGNAKQGGPVGLTQSTQRPKLPTGHGLTVAALKPKDRLMIPARLALALQDDGWFLRMEIVWDKPNPMPESVTDRPTNSHEMIYMLSKNGRDYFYDQEASREPYATKRPPGSRVSETGHIGGNGNKGLTDELEKVKERLHAELVHPEQQTLDPSLPPAAPRGPDGRRKTTVTGGKHSIQQRDGERWRVRPQLKRAQELFEEKGLTQAHLEAIRAVGITDVGKAQQIQNGFGKSDPEMQRLADEAKAALGGYYREFLTPSAGRNMRSVWTALDGRADAARLLAEVFVEAMRSNDEVLAATVWQMATAQLKDAHFAVFPEELVRKALTAGCPELVCRICGRPRERLVESEGQSDNADRDYQGIPVDGGPHRGNRGQSPKKLGQMGSPLTSTVGWSDCGHDDWRPGRVLDPFLGSGTTALVARKMGLHAVGVELSADYATLIEKRLQQQSLFA